ncbi:MAG: TonB-dependent receptor [Gemmatimonadaceae bacterium]|jgi:iron complex outermembrane receptor protein|nr:TonB-dependent receptor [Gemmatimonadaceae bacterium]
MIRRSSGAIALAIVSQLMPVGAHALHQPPPPRRDSTITLDTARIVAEGVERVPIPRLQLATLPVSTGIGIVRARQQVNLIDTQDAVKYLPSVFVRKRNNGDTQSVMATRVWGVSSSARSLIFADGVPLTALIANNNTIGGPRWGLVAPLEVARIDLMHGPYSAAYAGNSMGAVMEITTRMPERFEGALSQTASLQRFDLYATRRTFGTSQTSAQVGNRYGKLSVWASGQLQHSESQPLSYVTAAAFPAGTTGGIAATNRVGASANVLGATGFLSTNMLNGKVKLAWDLTPTVRVAYTLGLWQNDGDAGVQSFLQAPGGVTFAGQGAFANGFYDLRQRHRAQSLTVRTTSTGRMDWEFAASQYRFDTDQQRFPVAAAATTDSFSTAGRMASFDGTGWGALDLKVSWRSAQMDEGHTISAGVHHDRYSLVNPTWNTAEWREGALTNIATLGRGRTRTNAIWLQEAWRLHPALKLTVGGRYEWWRAFDGLNQNGSTRVVQPAVEMERFSPKGILAWTPSSPWSATLSMGRAFRFATASELYQLVSTGVTFTSPAPDLRPDNVLSTELRVARVFPRGRAQLALFQDNVRDAIISQFRELVPNSPILFSYLANVDRVRARGAEVVLSAQDVGFRGFSVEGTATYLDARTLAISGRASATAALGAAIGKFLPNIPRWRASFVTTYRPIDRLSITAAGRYSDRLWATLDNTEVNPNVFQGFSGWFVADARAQLRLTSRWVAALGVDNLLDRKYFLFHPFPHRTVIADVSVRL